MIEWEDRGRCAIEFFVYAGCYTEGSSGGIYAARFSSETGALRPVGIVGTMQNASFLCMHSWLPVIYAVSEVNEFKGEGTGALMAWRINAIDGGLTLICARSTGGRGPCHVAVEPGGTMAIVANYVDGSVAAYRIEQDGSISERTSLFRHEGSGPDARRQTRAHAHQIAIAPGGKCMIAPDLGADRLYGYSINRVTVSLEKREPEFLLMDAGAGPRHVTFDPAGRFAYVLGELVHRISVFAIESDTFALRFCSSIALPSRDGGEKDLPAEIGMDSAGRFLYCSYRGADELLVYAVGEHGGLELCQRMPSEARGPRHLVLAPGEKFLLVAGTDGDVVRVFSRDDATGLLSKTETRWEVPQPACVVFSKWPASDDCGRNGPRQAGAPERDEEIENSH